MKSQKHHPNDNLQKSSIIFLQLGLILAMLFVYGILESKFELKEFAFLEHEIPEVDTFIYPEAPPEFTIEKPKKIIEIVEPEKPKKPSNDFILDENDSTEPDTPINSTEPIDDSINDAINELPNTTIETEDEPVLFVLLEEAPIYPGCENLSKEEARACFTKRIKKFVNRNFDTDLAQELGLSGKQKIHVQFIIDASGNVSNIKTKAPHKRLEKETVRIIEKLPQMTPGKQRKRPVPVKYTLPISFEVY